MGKLDLPIPRPLVAGYFPAELERERSDFRWRAGWGVEIKVCSAMPATSGPWSSVRTVFGLVSLLRCPPTIGA
jgi:hypothetical protein